MKHWDNMETAERVAAITQLRDEGKLKAEIAEILQTTVPAVWGVACRNNITGLKARVLEGWNAKSVDERKALIVAGMEAGLTAREIAEEHGVTLASLAQFASRRGIMGLSTKVISRVPKAEQPTMVKDTRPLDPAAWVPIRKPVPLVANTGCCWPVGPESDRTQCGGEVHRKSYCEHHFALAYRQPKAAVQAIEDYFAKVDEIGTKTKVKPYAPPSSKKIWRSEDE